MKPRPPRSCNVTPSFLAGHSVAFQGTPDKYEFHVGGMASPLPKERIMSNFISIPETARILNCDPQTVRKLVREGSLPYFRAGKFIRVDASALKAKGGES